MGALSSYMKTCEFLESMVLVKPVDEIKLCTLFLGNPKCPCGQGFSASMGEGLWIKTPHGVASVSNRGYDGSQSMKGWVIEGYIPLDTDLISTVVKLKKDFVTLLFFARCHQNSDLHELVDMVMKQLPDVALPLP